MRSFDLYFKYSERGGAPKERKFLGIHASSYHAAVRKAFAVLRRQNGKLNVPRIRIDIEEVVETEENVDSNL